MVPARSQELRSPTLNGKIDDRPVIRAEPMTVATRTPPARPRAAAYGAAFGGLASLFWLLWGIVRDLRRGRPTWTRPRDMPERRETVAGYRQAPDERRAPWSQAQALKALANRGKWAVLRALPMSWIVVAVVVGLMLARI